MADFILKEYPEEVRGHEEEDVVDTVVRLLKRDKAYKIGFADGRKYAYRCNRKRKSYSKDFLDGYTEGYRNGYLDGQIHILEKQEPIQEQEREENEDKDLR